MKTLLKITDNTLAGKLLNEMTIELDTQTLTLKDIIAARVETEVQKYNEKAAEYFRGLVRPADAEETLNGYRMRRGQAIDAEKQVYLALQAFRNHGYFVFVGDRQVDDLDELVHFGPETTVSFVKLMPLVGG